jgi:hypothetical protein
MTANGQAAAPRAEAAPAGGRTSAGSRAGRPKPAEIFDLDQGLSGLGTQRPERHPGPASGGLDGLVELEEGPPLSPRGSFAPAVAPGSQPSAEAKTDKPAKKKKKRKKRASAGLSAKEILGTMAAIGGTIFAVIVLAAALPDSRAPLGIVVGIAGGIISFVGRAALMGTARDEGGFHSLLIRFIPLYAIIFIATHWQDTREHVVIYVVGVSLFFSGVAVFTSAPENRAKFHPRENHDSRPAEAEKGIPSVLKVPQTLNPLGA